MSAFPVTIYHNPACGTSRNTLAMIRAAGIEPTVIEYLKTGWTRPQLEKLFSDGGVSPRDWLRTRGTEAEALGLTDEKTPDHVILEVMLKQPVLVNRPIVVTPKGTALCRPPESVMALLK